MVELDGEILICTLGMGKVLWEILEKGSVTMMPPWMRHGHDIFGGMHGGFGGTHGGMGDRDQGGFGGMNGGMGDRSRGIWWATRPRWIWWRNGFRGCNITSPFWGRDSGSSQDLDAWRRTR